MDKDSSNPDRSAIMNQLSNESVKASDIAQTELGQKAFTIVLSKDLSWDAYQMLDGYATASKKGIERHETSAAIEAFIVAGGTFTEPIDALSINSGITRSDSLKVSRYTAAIGRIEQKYGLQIRGKQ